MNAQPVVVERDFVVSAPRERVWAFLRDPARLSACLPGVSEVSRVDDGRFRAVVEVTIALLTARFEVELRIAEERPPEFLVAEMSGEDGRTGTRLETRNRLALEARGADETGVSFRIDARLSGKLAALGGGTAVRLKSRQMARDFAGEVKRRIEDSGSHP